MDAGFWIDDGLESAGVWGCCGVGRGSCGDEERFELKFREGYVVSAMMGETWH